MRELVVSDTSCLIVLTKIGELELLHKRYERVLIPPAVAREYKLLIPAWIEIVEPGSDSINIVANFEIDPGEKEAIALALDHPGATLIADDEDARFVAERLRLPLTGTLGVLVKAKKAGLIPSIKPLINKIKETDFRISSSIVQRALNEAGEE